MADFAVNVAASYEVGAARGNLSILSAMEITPAGFFANFGQSINELILAHRAVLEQKRKLDTSSTRRHATVGPKGRWVDGTPEYSLHICGLRKLFPGALFIHLVRDVDAVVRSLLNFHRISGIHLVANEEDAYDHWLCRVRACLKAEQAYGPHVVRRVSYSTLVENPELAMQSLLGFVGEAYSARCLEPLKERINSSKVPSDFESADPATDPAVVEEARHLSAELEQTAQPNEPSAAVAEDLEVEFHRLCLRARTIGHESADESARHKQHHGAAVADREIQYKSRLRKQRREIQKLTAMLDELSAGTAKLRSSRFWKFVNGAAAIEAKLFRNEAFAPSGRLEDVVSNYARWRASHPNAISPDEPIEVDEPRSGAKRSDMELECLSETQVMPKVLATRRTRDG
jgi:hypothetical protein